MSSVFQREEHQKETENKSVPSLLKQQQQQQQKNKHWEIVLP